LFKLSNDPRFANKLIDTVGLYVNPPEHAVVSIDEKSQIQALDRTQPGPPMKKGRCGNNGGGWLAWLGCSMWRRSQEYPPNDPRPGPQPPHCHKSENGEKQSPVKTGQEWEAKVHQGEGVAIRTCPAGLKYKHARQTMNGR
jgi:hypothetical protein